MYIYNLEKSQSDLFADIVDLDQASQNVLSDLRSTLYFSHNILNNIKRLSKIGLVNLVPF